MSFVSLRFTATARKERLRVHRDKGVRYALSKAETADVLTEIFGTRSDAFDRKGIAMDDAGRRGRSKDLNLTYGEYDLDLFTKLLDRASPAQGDTFLDLGSGCGRLVLAAWMLYDHWKRCFGVEIVDPLHKESIAKYGDLRQHLASLEVPCPTASVDFIMGDLNETDFSEADVVFCYSTTWDSAGPVLTTLSRRLSEELRPGTRVITTDKMLAEVCDVDGRGFQLLDQIDGSNKDTFFSTGYVWERIDRTNLEELVPRPSPSF